MLPTLLAAAGDTTVKDTLLKGKTIGGSTYTVHLDGYNLLPALKGEAEWPRKEFIYWTDDGSVAALRFGNWKATFLRQDAHGLHVWMEPFVPPRTPMLTKPPRGPVRARARHRHGLRALVRRAHVHDCSRRVLRRSAGSRASGVTRRGTSRAASTSTASWKR